ncbi:ATP-binding cassette domain-containing protein [Alsobacter sp. SYSU M60028]|uniref:ATP-binding cassette domain-containing protein n=1 Tax=Alsobacter ponti TaxID=2962936 RepID=A0ABT1L7V5_9HYPH|nr:oligopeptide/dipeptide ABC transporter ATP-binding protein [Alsobacter ponti]MCP8937576.1 ATP-binding cassette domain-containing protein [Alsobacter ponti]
MSAATPLLELDRLGKRFPVRRGPWAADGVVHAVRDVSLSLAPGETLGVVGESGCGKSTLARMAVRLIEPSEGAIKLAGRDITALPQSELIPLRRTMQMVFQDPYSSLNPRMRAGDIVGEPLLVHGVASGRELDERVRALFAQVGLRDDQTRNFPSQFSGGQRQRLAIARALALDPALIVADEPVSALDVSIQAQVVNLLVDLQARRGLSYLFIAHDLGIVRHVSDRVAVMYLGAVVETGPARALFAAPAHPYTRLLLEAIPRPVPRRTAGPRARAAGEIPSPLDPPPGCAFHPRCPLATAICREERPALRPLGSGVEAACHHA